MPQKHCMIFITAYKLNLYLDISSMTNALLARINLYSLDTWFESTPIVYVWMRTEPIFKEAPLINVVCILQTYLRQPFIQRH